METWDGQSNSYNDNDHSDNGQSECAQQYELDQLDDPFLPWGPYNGSSSELFKINSVDSEKGLIITKKVKRNQSNKDRFSFEYSDDDLYESNVKSKESFMESVSIEDNNIIIQPSLLARQKNINTRFIEDHSAHDTQKMAGLQNENNNVIDTGVTNTFDLLQNENIDNSFIDFAAISSTNAEQRKMSLVSMVSSELYESENDSSSGDLELEVEGKYDIKKRRTSIKRIFKKNSIRRNSNNNNNSNNNHNSNNKNHNSNNKNQNSKKNVNNSNNNNNNNSSSSNTNTVNLNQKKKRRFFPFMKNKQQKKIKKTSKHKQQILQKQLNEQQQQQQRQYQQQQPKAILKENIVETRIESLLESVPKNFDETNNDAYVVGNENSKNLPIEEDPICKRIESSFKSAPDEFDGFEVVENENPKDLQIEESLMPQPNRNQMEADIAKEQLLQTLGSLMEGGIGKENLLRFIQENIEACVAKEQQLENTQSLVEDDREGSLEIKQDPVADESSSALISSGVSKEIEHLEIEIFEESSLQIAHDLISGGKQIPLNLTNSEISSEDYKQEPSGIETSGDLPSEVTQDLFADKEGDLINNVVIPIDHQSPQIIYKSTTTGSPIQPKNEPLGIETSEDLPLKITQDLSADAEGSPTDLILSEVLKEQPSNIPDLSEQFRNEPLEIETFGDRQLEVTQIDVVVEEESLDLASGEFSKEQSSQPTQIFTVTGPSEQPNQKSLENETFKESSLEDFVENEEKCRKNLTSDEVSREELSKTSEQPEQKPLEIETSKESPLDFVRSETSTEQQLQTNHESTAIDIPSETSEIQTSKDNTPSTRNQTTVEKSSKNEDLISKHLFMKFGESYDALHNKPQILNVGFRLVHKLGCRFTDEHSFEKYLSGEIEFSSDNAPKSKKSQFVAKRILSILRDKWVEIEEKENAVENACPNNDTTINDKEPMSSTFDEKLLNHIKTNVQTNQTRDVTTNQKDTSNQITYATTNQIKDVDTNQKTDATTNQIRDVDTNQAEKPKINQNGEITPIHIEDVTANKKTDISTNQIKDVSYDLEFERYQHGENQQPVNRFKSEKKMNLLRGLLRKAGKDESGIHCFEEKIKEKLDKRQETKYQKEEENITEKQNKNDEVRNSLLT